jgi:hypothetical protein
LALVQAVVNEKVPILPDLLKLREILWREFYALAPATSSLNSPS